MRTLLSSLCLLLAAASLQARIARPLPTTFVASWATAAEPTGDQDMPRTTNLTGCSIRQVIHVSLGGQVLRLRLSNEFSREPLEIKTIYIADARDSSAIEPRTARYLTFGGQRSVTIAPGAALQTDAVHYTLRPLQRLAVTVCYGQAPQNATSHRGSRTTSYIMPGLSRPGLPFATTERVEHWYNIAALDVAVDAAPAVVAVLGNSITDGRGTTTDAQNRWTDVLAEGLRGQVGVLNLGIGGNCVVRGGLSQPAVERFDRDVLGQTGLTHVIVFEGVNDIGGSTHAEQTARELIQAYQEFIQKAHDRGLQIYGATITPFGQSFYWSFFHEAVRQTVNDWLRTSGAFDGILDFDALMRDPADPTRLREQWQSDWLHLNPQGYSAMGSYAADWLRARLGI